MLLSCLAGYWDQLKYWEFYAIIVGLVVALLFQVNAI